MDYDKPAKIPAFAFNDTNQIQNTRFYKNVNVAPSTSGQLNLAENCFANNQNGFHCQSQSYHHPNTHQQQPHQPLQMVQPLQQQNGQNNIGHVNFSNFSRQRFTPYYNKRSYANALMQQTNPPRYFNFASQQYDSEYNGNNSNSSLTGAGFQSALTNDVNNNTVFSTPNQNQILFGSAASSNSLILNNGSRSNSISGACDSTANGNSCVTLQISNLDTSIDERSLKQYLISKLKPITTVLSVYFESISVAKIKLPSAYHAKQVIAFLHRKKIGHKRITVSYTRESSSTEPSTLRCQVAGLLKDIPNYKLSMFKFRELFQSRFKTSISVIDLYEMKDICTIIENKNEEKYIALRSELVNAMENSELMECLQHSVPFCTLHFVKSHRGWAEQEIDPLPNVQMNIAQVRSITYALLKNHKGDIPIASIVHCIQSELQLSLDRDESGVNFEHLISCVSGVQITSNKFGIKILSWLNPETAIRENASEDGSINRYSKYGNIPDSFSQVSREIVELIKLSPKSTLKFSRFIPAYHNHFGKQCRVADYGYTKLIDLFEALSSVVQVMGDGENRQITLTHKVQVRRFTSDLLRILRSQSAKSILLSQMATAYEQVQSKKFDVTDYGVCDVSDILDGLVNSNVVVVNTIPHVMDFMISIPKRKQSSLEIEKTSIFAGEVVELFKHASQFTIPFEKFACSYHYHFGYQCRLCDYGFLKLADLMEAITGIVEMEFSNEEDRKIFLSPKTAQRIFSEQLKVLIETFSGASDTMMNLHEVLVFHKKHYGYQIVPQSLGFNDMLECFKALPYVEMINSKGYLYVKCHHDDQGFRQKCYAACRIILESEQQTLSMVDMKKIFLEKFNESLSDGLVESMKHAIEIQSINDAKYVTLTKMMQFIVHIINIIRREGAIKITDLKNILKLSINACFPFGYPNLTSLIQAFPDIFQINNLKSFNARPEITLNTQCILTKDEPINIGISYVNDLIDVNNNTTFNNSLNKSAPNSSFSDALSLSNISNNNSNNSILSSTISQLEMNIHPAFGNNSSLSHTNDLNSSDQSHQLPFHSTKILNNTFDGNVSGYGTISNLSSFEDKENIFGIGQSSTNLHKSQNESYNENLLSRSVEQSFDKVKDDGGNKGVLNSYYNPPKPETPPQDMPFWLDPIWGADPLSPNITSLNIKIPELKIINAEPNLDTPTTMAALAKNKQFSLNNKESPILKTKKETN